MLINLRDAADLKLCLLITLFFADESGKSAFVGSSVEPALHAGFVPPADFGYSRARE